jgi:hypothetical protein
MTKSDFAAVPTAHYQHVLDKKTENQKNQTLNNELLSCWG